MSSRIERSGLSGFSVPGAKLLASISAGALTVALTQGDGSDPSPGNPLYVAMQKTAGDGSVFEGRFITTRCSVTMGSGKEFGSDAGKPLRVWACLLDDAGTFRLGLINCSVSTGIIYPLIDYSLQTTAVPASMSLIGQIYSDQVITSKPFVTVGYLDWTSGSATYWDTLPTFIGMSGPNSPRPGDALQDNYQPFSSAYSLSGTIPFDDTIPQSSEGVEVTSVSLTTQASMNIVDTEFSALFSYSIAASISMAVFRDTGSGYAADAINSTYRSIPAADDVREIRLFDRRQASVAGLVAYSWRAGGSTAGTLYVNRNSGGRKLGGSAAGYYRLVERMG